jgi:hypothetical protein
MRKVFFVFGGITYCWHGWYGCQLLSMEWRTAPAGTTRLLDLGDCDEPVKVTVYSTHREGLKVRTTWCINNSGTHDEHHQRILDLRDRLRRLV